MLLVVLNCVYLFVYVVHLFVSLFLAELIIIKEFIYRCNAWFLLVSVVFYHYCNFYFCFIMLLLFFCFFFHNCFLFAVGKLKYIITVYQCLLVYQKNSKVVLVNGAIKNILSSRFTRKSVFVNFTRKLSWFPFFWQTYVDSPNI